MTAALCLKDGVLYVGRGAMTAWIGAFDLDGHVLDPGFGFRAPDGGRAAVSGLAVDEDHRLWVADAATRSLRCFTLFGDETARVSREELGVHDVAGEVGAPVDLLSFGSDDAHRLLVASRGVRRHALQVLPLGAAAGLGRSLRPLGDPNGRFRGIARLAAEGRLVYVCEPRAARVQVFRDLEFHYELALEPPGERPEPRAIAPLPDGRAVLAHGGERACLLLLDPGGRTLSVLAGPGKEEGSVLDPVDLVAAPDPRDDHARVALLDLGGDRVQVLNLEGRCYGSFTTLPGASARSRRRARERRFPARE